MGAFGAEARRDPGFGLKLRYGALGVWRAAALCCRAKPLGVVQTRLKRRDGLIRGEPEKLAGFSGQMRNFEQFPNRRNRLPLHKGGKNKKMERQPEPSRAAALPQSRPFVLLLQGPAGPF